MNCPHCHANLEKRNARGETLIRGRGLVLKSQGGLAMICPKCKDDVPVPPATMQRLHQVAVLFFKHR